MLADMIGRLAAWSPDLNGAAALPMVRAAWGLWPLLALFMAVLVFFHSSEFLLAATFNREGLSWDCEFWLVRKR